MPGDILYNYFLMPMAGPALSLASLWNDKARAAVEGRVGWERRLADQLDGRSGKRVLLHSPSVGEFLQGKAVLDVMLDRYPDLAAVVTHFSPSAKKITAAYERAAASEFLPLDTLRNVTRFYEIADPSFVAFSRADVWPNFARATSGKGIPSALVAGSLSEPREGLVSSVQSFARRGLIHLDFIGAISEEDGELFLGEGVAPDKIEVTGDPRYDQTWDRARSVDRSEKLFDLFPDGGWNIVAGSTWPRDEDTLIPAFAKLNKNHPEARMILAPHEPSPQRIASITKSLGASNLSCKTLSQLENEGPKEAAVILVDRVGVLAKLYALGKVAFVGGSFVRKVHNVMEPACFGLPVIVGPHHRNSREALGMIGGGGCLAVADELELFGAFDHFIADEDYRAESGGKAMELVDKGRGAAGRTMDVLEKRFPGIFPPK